MELRSTELLQLFAPLTLSCWLDESMQLQVQKRIRIYDDDRIALSIISALQRLHTCCEVLLVELLLNPLVGGTSCGQPPDLRG